jgi:hypothetical protein
MQEDVAAGTGPLFSSLLAEDGQSTITPQFGSRSENFPYTHVPAKAEMSVTNTTV